MRIDAWKAQIEGERRATYNILRNCEIAATTQPSFP
jgi:hypothetical protein